MSGNTVIVSVSCGGCSGVDGGGGYDSAGGGSGGRGGGRYNDKAMIAVIAVVMIELVVSLRKQ